MDRLAAAARRRGEGEPVDGGAGLPLGAVWDAEPDPEPELEPELELDELEDVPGEVACTDGVDALGVEACGVVTLGATGVCGTVTEGVVTDGTVTGGTVTVCSGTVGVPGSGGS